MVYSQHMDIVLSHFTALETLRSSSLRHRLLKGERCAASPPQTSPSPTDLARALDLLPERIRAISPPDILLAHDAPRTRPQHVKTHRALDALPADSAIELVPGIRCVSPEHLAVQLAPQLTELELICLLSELLGTYSIAEELEGGMFQRRSPLTTPELIASHIELLGPAPGTAKVRHALKVACVGSASPRETKASLRIGLRKGLGGYGLKVLSMNDPLMVRRIHDSMKQGVRKPDILLLAPGPGKNGKPFRGVALEYDGKDHNGFEQHSRDVERHNELAAIGLTEYVITKKQYDDLDYMDGLAEIIRCELEIPKVRVKRSVAAKYRSKREELYRELDAIDGVHWNCLAGGRSDGRSDEKDTAVRAEDDGWDTVPVDAYEL